MILAPVMVDLTRSLEVLLEKQKQGPSSYEETKKKCLTYLCNIFREVPNIEYHKLIQDEEHIILIGYNLNILCRIAANEKSRAIRSQVFEAISLISKRLLDIHQPDKKGTKCSILALVNAIPGVISTLIRLLMSDTKLPKSLLVAGTSCLADFLTASLEECDHCCPKHDWKHLEMKGQHLEETCDNLATRLNILIGYTLANCNVLSMEVKFEILKLCEVIVFRTRTQLISRMLESLIKYTAYLSSAEASTSTKKEEVELKVMLVLDRLRYVIETEDTNCDSLLITTVSRIIDNLDDNYRAMLISERESELSMLHGIIKLLPSESMTTLFEVPDKRAQLLKLLVDLSQFATDQPFLFLTDSQVCDKALETNIKIYLVEKRFAHLTGKETEILEQICQSLGRNVEWFVLSSALSDLTNELKSSNSLHVARLILSGCFTRHDHGQKIARYAFQRIIYYLDRMQDEYTEIFHQIEDHEHVDPEVVLKMVIAVETIVTFSHLHHSLSTCEHQKTLLLQPLLCPLLNWCSSSNRAISEAALSTINQLSRIYGHDSVKSLIEANVDYIVDGVAKMLENFVVNPDITNVLALTLKLSSIRTLYYFQDIYEKIFELLGTYHQTDIAKPLILLFYRTLSILADWVTTEVEDSLSTPPLETSSGTEAILVDLDIYERIHRLRNEITLVEEAQRELEHLQKTKINEEEVIEEVKGATNPFPSIEPENKSTNTDIDSSTKPEKSMDILLTERIMSHCLHLISSNYDDIKILALRTISRGFRVLKDQEDTLLPLVHKVWSPLLNRLTGDYGRNLEVNLCAFECLVAMAFHAKDFIKSRTLDLIIPRLCLFLESQASSSLGQKDYGPYCMTMLYKCQLKILSHLGALAYHIQLTYTGLWRLIRTTLVYLDSEQNHSLRSAAYTSLLFMMCLDADCVWYFAKVTNKLRDLPFDQIYLLDNH